MPPKAEHRGSIQAAHALFMIKADPVAERAEWCEQYRKAEKQALQPEQEGSCVYSLRTLRAHYESAKRKPQGRSPREKSSPTLSPRRPPAAPPQLRPGRKPG
eukprot:TRINITY_DN4984_c0_g1_i1.p2 TRINITY_DN4984_c0_g1~~TRINITY_DN4984_c0_g1_i1.p2  ORF type:complete len:102 (+),score=23.13 TRINITY_DN4984_c0_g1_i1:182-487(+)